MQLFKLKKEINHGKIDNNCNVLYARFALFNCFLFEKITHLGSLYKCPKSSKNIKLFSIMQFSLEAKLENFDNTVQGILQKNYNNYITNVSVRLTGKEVIIIQFPGLGTAFFSVQNVPFFPVLKREKRPKRTLRSCVFFSKERKRAERT